MAYPTAIGCGCLLGAGGAAHVHAAEWSAQPTLSWTSDYDSNRTMVLTPQSSEQAVLSADLLLQRSLETLQLRLEPHFDVRRFNDSEWGPGDDRALNAALSWTGVRSQLNMNGAFSDQNTLTGEALETGLTFTNTRRRTKSLNGELDLARTENHLFFTQLSYMATDYSGPLYVQYYLPGYRYESGAAGERFMLTEHFTLSASAFGDLLQSDRSGGNSHEGGGQVELNYAHSEKTTFDVLVGESRRSLYGGSSFGTNIAATATHTFELSSVSLAYTRNLMPYGNGFLVERQQLTASYKRSLTPYLDADLGAVRVQNNSSTVLLGVDRRFYDNLGGGLSWRLSENWMLRSEASTTWTPPEGSEHTAHEWRAALIMTWKPLPQVISR